MLVYIQQESAFLFILALKVVFPTARVLIREPLHLIGPLLWVFFFSTVPSFSSLPRAIEDSRGCNCLIIQSTSTQAQKLYSAMDLLSRPFCFLSFSSQPRNVAVADLLSPSDQRYCRSLLQKRISAPLSLSFYIVPSATLFLTKCCPFLIPIRQTQFAGR